ncbi:MAG: hypothetical protein ACRDNF_13130 [Streptosporangiaceae bacterium]
MLSSAMHARPADAACVAAMAAMAGGLTTDDIALLVLTRAD